MKAGCVELMCFRGFGMWGWIPADIFYTFVCVFRGFCVKRRHARAGRQLKDSIYTFVCVSLGVSFVRDFILSCNKKI